MAMGCVQHNSETVVTCCISWWFRHHNVMLESYFCSRYHCFGWNKVWFHIISV